MNKMKRKIAYLLIATMLFCMGISIWGGEKKVAATQETTFVLGFDAEFPPYGYKNDAGEYVGYDLDLAQEVCKRNNWKLVKQPIDWDSKDMELQAGNISCIWNGFTINGREKEYTWSKAYIDNSQVVIVKNDSDINKLEELAGKVVVVQADSSALAAFQGDEATEENKALCASFAELQQVSDYNSAFMNLESGAVDAICMDIGVANYQVKNRGNAFRLLSEQVSSEQYGIGFLKGNTELRDQVQETLDAMLADGTFDKITKQWELSDCACLGKEGTDSAYLQDAKEAVSGSAIDAKNDGSTSVEKKIDYVGIAKQLGEGMLATIAIFACTVLFAMPLGLLVCVIRMSKYRILQWIARIYISILRGTPLMLQLLVVFFGPHYIFGVSMGSGYRFYAVIIGFSLNYAAYFAEIFRSGILAVPQGQREAAYVLGYSKNQTFWKIVFPQMAKHVIPPVTNEIITLVKDTSLAFAIAYTEMFTLAKQVAAAQTSVVPLFVAGIFYYVFNFIVAMIMERVERSVNYDKK